MKEPYVQHLLVVYWVSSQEGKGSQKEMEIKSMETVPHASGRLDSQNSGPDPLKLQRQWERNGLECTIMTLPPP